MGRPTLEQLFGPFFRGAPTTKAQSAANQYAGITTLNSGSATVTVSTTIVGSDSLVLFGTVGNANVASGTAIRHIEVKSISPGNFVTFGTQDGIAIARNTEIRFQIWKTS